MYIITICHLFAVEQCPLDPIGSCVRWGLILFNDSHPAGSLGWKVLPCWNSA